MKTIIGKQRGDTILHDGVAEVQWRPNETVRFTGAEQSRGRDSKLVSKIAAVTVVNAKKLAMTLSNDPDSLRFALHCVALLSVELLLGAFAVHRIPPVERYEL